MVDLVLSAIPAFIVLMVVEIIALRVAAHDHGDTPGPVGYELRDTRTSLTMGVGNVVINVGWKLVVVAAYAALYELSPLRMPADAWWTYAALFVAEDLSYYWAHRGGHRIRLLWASHVVHHSSRHYNLSTALRQTWTPMDHLIFWSWLPLVGFSPWMILLAQSWSLLFQFHLHTEKIGRLPRVWELVFNTPSHHRVHHGSQAQYLDRNYGGILIVWDRLFGTFEPERERVRYGLTRNIETFNPVRVAFHEYVAIWGDLRRAGGGLRDRVGYLFGPPGWTPAPAISTATTPGSNASRPPMPVASGSGNS